MKAKTKSFWVGLAVLVAVGCFVGSALSVAAATTTSEPVMEVQILEGFNADGASVKLSEEKQLRFQISLTDAAAEKYSQELSDKTLQSGVVVLPYDLYQAEELEQLTMETEKAQKTSVSSTWEMVDSKYQAYAYMDTGSIPHGQENRVLVARGYIIDGATVYYTEEMKASMAYVAWKNLDNFPEESDKALLKGYMGPYTLTYGTEGKLENLYYGDPVLEKLPEKVDEKAVEGWFWDESCEHEILPTDYATGSMPVYCAFKVFEVTGFISAADDLTGLEVYANGKEVPVTIDGTTYSILLEEGTYDLSFRLGKWGADLSDVVISGAMTQNVTLEDLSWEIGTYKEQNSEGYTNLTERDSKQRLTVDGLNWRILFPNQATTENFIYMVESLVLDFASSVNAEIGIAISNGTTTLTITFRQWGQTCINVSQSPGDGNQAWYMMPSDPTGGFNGYMYKQMKLVRTQDAIMLYRSSSQNDTAYSSGDRLLLTITADGVTGAEGMDSLANYGFPDTLTDSGVLAGFFGEGVELTVGLAGKGDEGTIKVNFNTNLLGCGELTGTVSNMDDLIGLRVYANGKEVPVTIDGTTYSILLEEGTYDLSFRLGKWGADLSDVVISGATTQDVTLEDLSWEIGTYKEQKSEGYTNLAERDSKQQLTVDGLNWRILFPNQATTENFVYMVESLTTTFSTDQAEIGLAVSNGTTTLTIGFRQWGQTCINVSQSPGDGNQAWYMMPNDPTGSFNGTSPKQMKLVRTQDAIMLYRSSSQNDTAYSSGDRLLLTITADGVTGAEGMDSLANYGFPDTLTDSGVLAGFFGEGVELTVGLAGKGNAVLQNIMFNIDMSLQS